MITVMILARLEPAQQHADDLSARTLPPAKAPGPRPAL